MGARGAAVRGDLWAGYGEVGRQGQGLARRAKARSGPGGSRATPWPCLSMGQLGDRIGVLTVILETEFVKALSVVLDHGLDAVEAACAEALEAGIAHDDVILAMLTRR